MNDLPNPADFQSILSDIRSHNLDNLLIDHEYRQALRSLNDMESLTPINAFDRLDADSWKTVYLNLFDRLHESDRNDGFEEKLIQVMKSNIESFFNVRLVKDASFLKDSFTDADHFAACLKEMPHDAIFEVMRDDVRKSVAKSLCNMDNNETEYDKIISSAWKHMLAQANEVMFYQELDHHISEAEDYGMGRLDDGPF